jgi:hypothetical protein
VTAPARPLYFRMLGVKHLRAGPVAAFVLFEGSIAAGALLALADVVSWWGFIAIPIVVAIMVKIHDRVARALVQPLAVVQMSANRPLRDRRKIGRSAVPGPSRLTTEIAGDDAVASPDAWPDQRSRGADPTAIGTAPVTSIGRAPVPGPGTSRDGRGTADPRGIAEGPGTADPWGTAEEPGTADGRGTADGHGAADGPGTTDGRGLAEGPGTAVGPGTAEGPPGPRAPSPTEQDGWLPARAEPMSGRVDRMDRLDPESRARGNQGHFDS